MATQFTNNQEKLIRIVASYDLMKMGQNGREWGSRLGTRDPKSNLRTEYNQRLSYPY